MYPTSSLERIADEDAVAPKHPSDQRRAFQRDRDRIIYSTAFRRIAGKTQVVAVEEFGLYHTRLTHSLKVAQLGRRLAERLQDSFANTLNTSPNLIPPNPDLVEAACLAHDLGHPPFGHIGERELRRAFDRIALDRSTAEADGNPTPEMIEDRALGRGGFEGNAQTFRLLTYLSARVPLEPRCGLNLTRATLDACTKYPWLRFHSGKFHDK